MRAETARNYRINQIVDRRPCAELDSLDLLEINIVDLLHTASVRHSAHG